MTYPTRTWNAHFVKGLADMDTSGKTDEAVRADLDALFTYGQEHADLSSPLVEITAVLADGTTYHYSTETHEGSGS